MNFNLELGSGAEVRVTEALTMIASLFDIPLLISSRFHTCHSHASATVLGRTATWNILVPLSLISAVHCSSFKSSCLVATNMMLASFPVTNDLVLSPAKFTSQ